MKRALAAVLAALALSGTVACDNTTSGNGGASSTSNPSPGELSDVQRTLDGIESDMAGDPAP